MGGRAWPALITGLRGDRKMAGSENGARQVSPSRPQHRGRRMHKVPDRKGGSKFGDSSTFCLHTKALGLVPAVLLAPPKYSKPLKPHGHMEPWSLTHTGTWEHLRLVC